MKPILNRNKVAPPLKRRLRAFAFDPILSRNIETHDINEVTIKLPWDKNLEPGPSDSYLEVVDYDPATQVFYAPVDLNDKHLLAQDGFPPSEGNPHFHQQMVYAVARTTIDHFERALGRRALWSPRYIKIKDGLKYDFVELLRIYPHALREANAYYSPAKKALLFGYFPASSTTPGENMPGETVFTCLSHDIVAHETTHALLDGLHRRFIEPTNVDVWALHEAFADIVALFQHFTYPEVLRHQIALTHGDLEKQNLLGGLAYQFGQAIERYGALRSAIGHFDKTKQEWVPERPDPEKILHTTEPHNRGAILVAAVFEAFLTIYKRRIADLLRISGHNTSLPQCDLHPDLVERLAQEAAKTARHMLNICIRALDYCPPVDVDFGDYLRALITADADLVTDDRHNYRLAITEAFRRRGIFPRDVRNLSEENLLWHKPDENEKKAFRQVFSGSDRMRELVPEWTLTTDRRKVFEQTQRSRRLLQQWCTNASARKAAKVARIVLNKNAPEAFYRDDKGVPTLEIHSVRPARRIGPDGEAITNLVIEMTQRRRGYYDPDIQDKADRGKIKPPKPDFIFRGGCTLIVDLMSAEVRYCIYKRIGSKNRLDRMREFLTRDTEPSDRTVYFGNPCRIYFHNITSPQKGITGEMTVEPFALLHRYPVPEEVV
ncbi:MAG: hypothetical protein OEV79_11140 [candidate division WOR-3 bacterium]|nr:hypothetical protein [candidate division WOR-3 bacterium]